MQRRNKKQTVDIFTLVQPGMTRKQVFEILGEPEDWNIGSRKYPNPTVYKYGDVQLGFTYPQDGGLVYIHQYNQNHELIRRVAASTEKYDACG